MIKCCKKFFHSSYLITVLFSVIFISISQTNYAEAAASNVIRYSGTGRYETSVLVAEEIGASSQVVLATGANFPDALSIAPIAASKGLPILLTDTISVPDQITQYLSSNTFTKRYVIGGTGVISN
jgi:putative cell wall-binding protein